jgi:hypothetical protein
MSAQAAIAWGMWANCSSHRAATRAVARRLEVLVGDAGGAGAEGLDGAGPQALADQQVGEALVDEGVLGELAGEGLEAAGGVDLAVDAGHEVVGEGEGAGDAGVGVELGGLEVEEAGAGVDVLAVAAAALVDPGERAEGVRSRGATPTTAWYCSSARSS